MLSPQAPGQRQPKPAEAGASRVADALEKSAQQRQADFLARFGRPAHDVGQGNFAIERLRSNDRGGDRGGPQGDQEADDA